MVGSRHHFSLAACVTVCIALTAMLVAAKPSKKDVVGTSLVLLCGLPGFIGGKGEKLCLGRSKAVTDRADHLVSVLALGSSTATMWSFLWGK